MVKETIKVNLETGLQARPAAHFVRQANRFISDIHIEKDNKRVNAKSIMGIMSLAISKGTRISIIAEGPDEEEAVEKLAELVSQEESE